MPVINGPFRVFGRTLSHFANNFVLLMKNSELDDNYWLAWWYRLHVDNSKYLRDNIDLVVTACRDTKSGPELLWVVFTV